MTTTTEPGTVLVRIVVLNGDDYEQAVDAANDAGGSTDAVAAYLAGWDYGAENDHAAPYNGALVGLAELEGLPHQLHEAHVDGLDYWLQADHQLRFYALYRRPLPTGDRVIVAALNSSGTAAGWDARDVTTPVR